MDTVEMSAEILEYMSDHWLDWTVQRYAVLTVFNRKTWTNIWPTQYNSNSDTIINNVDI